MAYLRAESVDRSAQSVDDREPCHVDDLNVQGREGGYVCFSHDSNVKPMKDSLQWLGLWLEGDMSVKGKEMVCFN